MSPSPRTEQAIIRSLRLIPHPEGGYYRETYRSSETLSKKSLPSRYRGKRSIATAIYYFLGRGDFSALHRIQSDELWCFHDGAPLELVTLSDQGVFSKFILGMNLSKGERPQLCIPRGVWFGAAVSAESKTRYTLISCMVAPGFDFADFEMADRNLLLKKFPGQRLKILKWTRETGKAKVGQ